MSDEYVTENYVTIRKKDGVKVGVIFMGYTISIDEIEQFANALGYNLVEKER